MEDTGTTGDRVPERYYRAQAELRQQSSDLFYMLNAPFPLPPVVSLSYHQYYLCKDHLRPKIPGPTTSVPLILIASVRWNVTAKHLGILPT